MHSSSATPTTEGKSIYEFPVGHGSETVTNGADYAAISSDRIGRALRLAHRLEAAVTRVNDHLPIASEAPHGGVKGSGFGKDMSHEAVLEYTSTHHVMVKHAQRQAHDSFRPA